MLLTASVIATIGGARLLDLQDPVDADASSRAITIVEPATSTSFSPVLQPGRRAAVELKPIPQAVVPRFNPVARARSSL